MATWWQDRGRLLPDIYKLPTGPRPGDDSEDEPAVPTEDVGTVVDDDSDEFDDVKLPDRGQDQ